MLLPLPKSTRLMTPCIQPRFKSSSKMISSVKIYRKMKKLKIHRNLNGPFDFYHKNCKFAYEIRKIDT